MDDYTVPIAPTSKDDLMLLIFNKIDNHKLKSYELKPLKNCFSDILEEIDKLDDDIDDYYSSSDFDYTMLPKNLQDLQDEIGGLIDEFDYLLDTDVILDYKIFISNSTQYVDKLTEKTKINFRYDGKS